MQGSRKIVGMFILVAFVLVAGSVVCLASGQPSVMTDCGNQMTETAMCPFMSIAIPTIPTASFGGELATILTLALVFIIVKTARVPERQEIVTMPRYRNKGERPPISFLNSILQLISQGILHSRVFGF